MSAERIDGIFHDIQNVLVPLIQRVRDSEIVVDTACLSGSFPVAAQEALCKKVVGVLGFDLEHGRLDVSVHPFTTSFGRADVRITSRFSTDEWYQGLAGAVHEGGHAMYEQNVGDSGLAVDSYLSMGTHESQSLFWERHIGLGRAYWKWMESNLQDAFGADGFPYSPEEIYAAANAVRPSLIRVEADELTYPLHVILRYNLERDVVDGKLDVADIPQAWKMEMKRTLGVDVPSDAAGCLQDVHWSALAVGYFPTYLIGAAAAAQLARYCRLDLPDMDEQIERGEFGEIRAWLTEKVHRHGRRPESLDELLEGQLGEKLNPGLGPPEGLSALNVFLCKSIFYGAFVWARRALNIQKRRFPARAVYFIDYLTAKYTELYGC
jgi:carboxypeptidase Taq